MALELYRVDDRLIHGQVVVGWGQPLALEFIVLVDDEVAGSDWEQELYRMGVPPEMSVYFDAVSAARGKLAEYQGDDRRGLLLTADVESMARLCTGSTGNGIRKVNLGGIHHRPGRVQRLRYVFLSKQEEDVLRSMEERGIEVTAQDVPGARPLPLKEILGPAGVR
ncbi:MAG: PTS system mannose/fructose/N-acetylgalactosamine-transporter subunit IIB [Gemmatimonadaceae bacterium]